jgi:hypothetical protein
VKAYQYGGNIRQFGDVSAVVWLRLGPEAVVWLRLGPEAVVWLRLKPNVTRTMCRCDGFIPFSHEENSELPELHN